MTREKLKKAIQLFITLYEGEGDLVEGIVMVVESCGWKSPEEVEEIKKIIHSNYLLDKLRNQNQGLNK